MPNDTNIDHQDLLLASGAFKSEECDEFMDSLRDEIAEEEYWESRYRELQLNPLGEF